MSTTSTSYTAPAATRHQVPVEPLLGLLTGMLGGALQSRLLLTPVANCVLLGGVFGLVFGLCFAKRATTPGAGLIWGLGSALLLWFLLPDGIHPWLIQSIPPVDMLNDAEEQFPQLVAYLVCLGMPVGLVLGIRGSFRSEEGQPRFRWGRAIVAGGLAGMISGLAFSGWEYQAGFYR